VCVCVCVCVCVVLVVVVVVVGGVAIYECAKSTLVNCNTYSSKHSTAAFFGSCSLKTSNARNKVDSS